MAITKRVNSICKSINYLLPIFFVVFLSLSVPSLNAAKWGKTEDVIKHEGVFWDKIFIDLGKSSFFAYMPNYSGQAKSGNLIHLTGHVNKKIGYLIETTCKTEDRLPRSEMEFIKTIRAAHSGYTVKAVSEGVSGAIYAVDLTPSDKSQKIRWRYVATKKNRLIKMGTDDRNKKRRLFFFESALIE